MNQQKVYNWLNKNFSLNSSDASDVRFNCPKCGYKNFYFNVIKRVGYCQKASCHYSPSLLALSNLPGKTPIELSGSDYMPPNPHPVYVTNPVSLDPYQFPKVLEFQDGRFFINGYDALDYLERRNITKEVINQYDIRYGFDVFGKERIYVPIYEGGKMVSYLGRLFKPGDVGLRYSYCLGTKINDHFLNYDYIANFISRVAFVENTFVAMSYGPGFSTNFGSHLSQVQIDKLSKTGLKDVLILWDGGADEAAFKAVTKLRKVGLRAAYVSLPGKVQPDELTKDKVEEICCFGYENLQAISGCAVRLTEDLNYARF